MTDIQVHIPYPLLIKRLDEILRAGINPEIYLDTKSLKTATGEELEEIGKAFAWAGRTVTLHGPYLGLNPAAPEAEIRLHTVDVYQMAFDAAARLCPKTIVLHAGYRTDWFKGDTDLWLAQSMKTWPRFVRLAQTLNIAIAIENIYEEAPQTQQRLLREIDSPCFGACLDTGHLNVFSKTPIEEWVRLLGPRLVETHLHDNDGKSDEHLPVGSGSFDFPAFLKLINTHAETPVFTIEPHGEDMIQKAVDAVRRLLPEAQA